LLFPYRPSNTCDGNITNCHFPLHQQPCILTQQHTLYLKAKLNKITITSIVVTTPYWNRKQWNTNLITDRTYFNTHKTTKTQFQTSCFNFLRLTIGLCSTYVYLFILTWISSSLSTKKIIVGTMDRYHSSNSYNNYYFEGKLDQYPQHCCNDKRFSCKNCKTFSYNKKCRQGGGM